MKKIYVPDLEVCTGCRICEMACSLFKEKVSSSRLSRIKVVTDFEEGLSYPVLCYQCDPAPCAEACPEDAIKRNQIGVWFVDPTKCIGCGACIEACPFGSITLHPDTGIAMKCDYCGGNPQCVDKCPTNAIQYKDGEEIRNDKAWKLGKSKMEKVIE